MSAEVAYFYFFTFKWFDLIVFVQVTDLYSIVLIRKKNIYFIFINHFRLHLKFITKFEMLSPLIYCLFVLEKTVFKMRFMLVVVLMFTLSIKLTYSKTNVGKFEIRRKFENGKLKHYAYLKGSPTWSAVALYDEYYDTFGWDIFETETSPQDSDEDQAYAAGYLEGSMTWKAIYTHYYNTFYNYCVGREELCPKIDTFLNKNLKWVNKMIRKNGKRSSPWHHIKLVYKQIKGVYDGYASACDADKVLTYKDILKINVQWDIHDLFQAFNKTEESASVRGDTHCSAIIKLLPNNSDIVLGHNAWNNYKSMVRMIKRYNHPYRTSAHSTMNVFGVSMAFSSYPGSVSSIDDFYIMNSKLVTLETSIDNNNKSLWNLINPAVVFEPIRALVANRLANNGRSWGEYFAPYNSGTYNNQWMIVDLNKFTPGSKPLLGLLYILEQMPGYVRMEDQTLLFLNQTYWPSYNIPFYEDVYNMSGYQDMVDKYGDWFTYDKNPRALIFKRDHANVTDPDSLLTLLRSNNYQNDPYSVCESCVPPYNAMNAVAARCDLNPHNGTYPFYAMGHRAYGAIDAKVMSSQWASTTELKAVCGPTTGFGLPVFKWSTSDFNDTVSHVGQPDSFQFDPIHVSWSFNKH